MHPAVKVSTAFKGHLKSSVPKSFLEDHLKGGEWKLEENSLQRNFAPNERFG